MVFRRLALVALIFFFAASARAEVVRIEVKSRADILAGKTFGKAGAYEKLSGKIYFAVDPRNGANRIIADVDKAPKNASGKVEFSSDFYLIKPKDQSRGNGTVLYEVSNRGNKGLLGFFNLATNSLDPETARDFGDGFLMDQGFTILWVGWQFDAPNCDGMLRVYVPAAHETNGRPIQGLVRTDFSTTQKTSDVTLSDTTYAVIDPKDAANVLTIRDSVEAGRRTIPRDQWAFSTDAKSIHMASGFEPNKIYEVVYKSQDPPIAGLGPAAVRNDLPGIRMPEIAVPLATYLGWNFMNERSGPTNELAALTGSFIPFARTHLDRERTNDPRPSIEERYRSKDDYLELISKSANDLATKGYILKEDIPGIIQQAGTRWDWVLGNPH
jgi:hypothetical protein